MTIAIVVVVLLVLALIKFFPVFAAAWVGTLLVIGLVTWAFQRSAPEPKPFGTPLQFVCATVLSVPLAVTWIVYHL